MQRERKARELDVSIAYALDWLNANATKLEAPVCRPALMTLNVPDKRYAKQIEMLLSRAQRNVSDRH